MNLKKTTAIILTLILCSVSVFAEQGISYKTSEYITSNIKTPFPGSVGGEWAVLGLKRSGTEVSEEFYESYMLSLENTLKKNDGILNENKYTEYSRTVLALSALGKNPNNIGGYNLLMPLADYNKTVKQGINGSIYALLALDSRNYDIPINPDAEIQADRKMYLDNIIGSQLSSGGFSMSGEEPCEADITAMALQALSKYKGNKGVDDVINSSLLRLSVLQNEKGGFVQYGQESCESTAQVISALCCLNISLSDERFIKSGIGLLDNLMSFSLPDGGFKHLMEDSSATEMATEQALIALAAINRAQKSENSVFDMVDAKDFMQSENGLPSKSKNVNYVPIIKGNADFYDVSDNNKINELFIRDIINGKGDKAFEPNSTMTRAEFATVITKALGFETKADKTFDDVEQKDWFFDYVGTAKFYGIISGISQTEFCPSKNITKEQEAVMLEKAAVLCGLNLQMDSDGVRNILAGFIDYKNVSDWALDAMAFCYETGIFDSSEIKINPKSDAERIDVAEAVYNLLFAAKLL